MRSTVLEVNKNVILDNIKKIQKYSKKEVMPIIKANGYGTYINKDLDFLNRFDIVGVALVQEGVELRNIGYKKDIFVLNQPTIDDIKDIIDNNLVIGLSSIEFLKLIKNEKIRVHLEIETGMNRTGIALDNLNNFIEIVKSKNIVVEGVYTHLSCADNDDEYTKMQLNKFNKAVEIVKKLFNSIKYIHSEASNGILKYNNDITNLVRAGIIMYGYNSFEGANKIIDFKPSTVLKTKISFLKEINENESVSYNRRFISKNKMKIATIPIGYADGLRRCLSNKLDVLVNNKKARVIGSICMDSCMIDVTNIDTKVGDTVYIWDNEKVTIDEIAKLCDTINYEILSTVSNRVIRIIK